MEVEVEEMESFPVLKIDGEITLYDIDLINKEVSNICKNGKYNIIVNMEKVPFMDSSGIGVFMQTIVRLSKNNGILYFTRCAKRVKSLLDFSIINTSSKIFETEIDAINELKKRESV